MNYKKEIKELIADRAGVEIEEIHDDSYFEDDLNIGEFELIDILTEIEDMYEIEDLLSRKQEFETVGELMDYLGDKLE
ncbi:hypothetical protein H6802_02140 [Candidatus Nomurabacteria bacterium]|uniref:Acyl carrier protein n=1 Tax=candidate division WWE3 bacterium TaxID=2053526 RepID=A0A955IWC9_UNCKA|nr:hypothetical protein [candidate division WWE3 bacterium]MCB9823732.1 hypothetical protein [Candidatus Nomurabacteria bacterium]MCB9827189.1 hypothetical protein [Candidatus Nomurabacteria bacterium]MCB9827527.1 hypothetical protein [Candidatus Nomurabacteria bacterium]HXK52922.1 hypothetical protein [bacterium]